MRSFLAVAIVAGTGLKAAPSQQPLAMPGYPTAGSPASVTLSASGAEPRAPLRLRIASGHRETILMTLNLGITMSMEGMALPAMDLPVMKMWADSVVTSVAPNGDISYDMGFTRLQVEAGPGGDANMAQMMQAAAGEITALKGSLVMNNRGINKTATIDVTKISDPNMRQTFSALSSQFDSMGMPLPEEAVGVGAIWEVRQAISSAGATVFQKLLCELTALDATGATIKVTGEQTAPPQIVTNPAMPGMQMNIEKVTGGGSGTSHVKFASLTPVSDMTSSTTMNVGVDMGGQTQRMAVQTNIRMSVAPDKK